MPTVNPQIIPTSERPTGDLDGFFLDTKLFWGEGGSLNLM